MTAELSSREFLIDWRAAEAAAARHMQSIGFIDAQVTESGADGGLDVRATDAVAQVKFYANPVGRPDIQKLRGAAHEHRIAIFYSTGGYTQEALDYAVGADVALFSMNPYGECSAVTGSAEILANPVNGDMRREKMAELIAGQYRLAGEALRRDVQLCRRYSEYADIPSAQVSLFDHAWADLDRLVRTFVAQVEERRFLDARTTFGDALRRTAFLSWIVGAELITQYADLESAIAEGWKISVRLSTVDTPERVRDGAAELETWIDKILSEWVASFPDDVRLDRSAIDQMRVFAGLYGVTGIDAEILPPDLLENVRQSLRTAVGAVNADARGAFDAIDALHGRLGVRTPSTLAAGRLRIESIAKRLGQQLGG
ncbi:hypothetical protein GCM10027515_19750 [Schumannella luteola]|uniref:Restriction endonuclease type IV Mrr domain-containing protein n=1 Tax=Schumannella luteola TaxID=472059 RepID=A0A852YR99_9MICO|nr:restriction endonuclease [Schumannella luteola]NYH00230.1 hypothetical protein [Schumannella luteola]TPX04023.1 restriction endonuclease [Schumannella luteola]